MQTSQYDILIVGGGMVGAFLACALAKETSLSIAVLESEATQPSWSNTHYHHRVSAISLASVRLFQAVDAWQRILQKRVSPFTKIEVWDEKGGGEIQFHSNEIAESLLGFIIENNVIQSALKEKIADYPNITWISPVKLVHFEEKEQGVLLTANDGRVFKAKLAIAADGANSWLREAAKMTIQKEDYEQSAVVTTVETASRHQQIARQVFLLNGPLAFLPLALPHLSSIVWSMPTEKVGELLQAEKATFKKALATAFSNRLGDILSVGNCFSFPLSTQRAKSYLASRVVLVGDAAHTIHPMAGQGVNMGLLDAACLAETISDTIKQHRDYSAIHNLKPYERWRKADNQTLLSGVGWIKKLFESNKKNIQSLRSMGINTTHEIRWIKNIFTRHAVGERGNLPRMAKG